MFKIISILAIAFLPLVGFGQTSSGTYTPLTTDHSTTINPIAQPAHYFRIDNEVFVYGSVFANGNPAIGKFTFFSVSLPIPTTTLNSVTTYGQCTVLGSLPAVSGGVSKFSDSSVQVSYNSGAALPSQVRFSFVYTIN